MTFMECKSELKKESGNYREKLRHRLLKIIKLNFTKLKLSFIKVR